VSVGFECILHSEGRVAIDQWRPVPVFNPDSQRILAVLSRYDTGIVAIPVVVKDMMAEEEGEASITWPDTMGVFGDLTCDDDLRQHSFNTDDVFHSSDDIRYSSIIHADLQPVVLTLTPFDTIRNQCPFSTLLLTVVLERWHWCYSIQFFNDDRAFYWWQWRY